MVNSFCVLVKKYLPTLLSFLWRFFEGEKKTYWKLSKKNPRKPLHGNTESIAPRSNWSVVASLERQPPDLFFYSFVSSCLEESRLFSPVKVKRESSDWIPIKKKISVQSISLYTWKITENLTSCQWPAKKMRAGVLEHRNSRKTPALKLKRFRDKCF